MARYSGLSTYNLRTRNKITKKGIKAVTYLELYEWVKSGGRKWRGIERESGQSMKEILSTLWDAGYNGPQIATKLGVHHSSVYRWLIRTGTRPAFTEIRRRGVINDQ